LICVARVEAARTSVAFWDGSRPPLSRGCRQSACCSSIISTRPLARMFTIGPRGYANRSTISAALRQARSRPATWAWPRLALPVRSRGRAAMAVAAMAQHRQRRHPGRHDRRGGVPWRSISRSTTLRRARSTAASWMRARACAASDLNGSRQLPALQRPADCHRSRMVRLTHGWRAPAATDWLVIEQRDRNRTPRAPSTAMLAKKRACGGDGSSESAA
jgi:hypothetical protein